MLKRRYSIPTKVHMFYAEPFGTFHTQSLLAYEFVSVNCKTLLVAPQNPSNPPAKGEWLTVRKTTICRLYLVTNANWTNANNLVTSANWTNANNFVISANWTKANNFVTSANWTNANNFVISANWTNANNFVISANSYNLRFPCL